MPETETKTKTKSKKSSSKKPKKSSSKKIYCGSDKPAKNQRTGSLQECHELGQVRLWGVKKADVKKLEKIKKDNINNSKMKTKLIKEIGTISGKMNYIKKNIDYQKDPEKKAKMKEDYKKLREKYIKLSEELKKVEAKQKKKIVITDEEYDKAILKAQENRLRKKQEQDEEDRRIRRTR